LQGGQDVGAQAALGLGQRRPEEPGLGDVHDEIAGELAIGLDLGGTLADARRQRAGDLKWRGCCRRRVGDHGADAILRQHRPPRQDTDPVATTSRSWSAESISSTAALAHIW
jgi:hypothetical protein